jgi:hypothetical protein
MSNPPPGAVPPISFECITCHEKVGATCNVGNCIKCHGERKCDHSKDMGV